MINKIDLASLVGASLELMDSDTKRMRGDKPFVFQYNQKTGHGLDTIVAFIERQLIDDLYRKGRPPSVRQNPSPLSRAVYSHIQS